jgi:DNA primase
MDAVSLIIEHLDVEKLLEHYEFDHVHADGDMIRACCKVHGGNNPSAFVMNRDRGLWTCHTGDCGSGDAFTLVEVMENIDFPSAVRWLARFTGVDINNLQITERKSDYVEELKKFVKLMGGKKKKKLQPFTISEEIKAVAKYRKFTEDTIRHFNLGYVDCVTLTKRDGEDYVLNNRLVFPIIFNDMQVGISFRRIKSTDYPKWSHQPASLTVGNILYNYDDVKTESVIVVVEGITDVWAYHEIGIPAVATFGAHVTDEQYKLLLKTGADIVLSYDGDDAGRNATSEAVKLFRYKANLSVVHFNEGEDPESIEREELRGRYNGRKKL